MSAWKKLIERYAGNRKICNCGEAYYAEDGDYCPNGCSAAQLEAREFIAKCVLKELQQFMSERRRSNTMETICGKCAQWHEGKTKGDSVGKCLLTGVFYVNEDTCPEGLAKLRSELEKARLVLRTIHDLVPSDVKTDDVAVDIALRLNSIYKDLGAAYAEMHKQRPTITAVFDQEVWDKIELLYSGIYEEGDESDRQKI